MIAAHRIVVRRAASMRCQLCSDFRPLRRGSEYNLDNFICLGRLSSRSDNMIAFGIGYADNLTVCVTAVYMSLNRRSQLRSTFENRLDYCNGVISGLLYAGAGKLGLCKLGFGRWFCAEAV